MCGQGFAPYIEQYQHMPQIHANSLPLFRAFVTVSTYSTTALFFW